MQPEQILSFGPYQVERANRQLYREKHLVKLTGKAFATLCYLAERAGQLVTKEELFAAVWPGTVVSDAALTVVIAEVRRALHDNARNPRFIAVVHRQGYRFVASLSTTPSPSQKSQVEISKSTLTPHTQHLAPTLVGRATELDQLRKWFAHAVSGHRQVVFVTGEAGIGKTTLVDAFLQQITTNNTKPWLGQGQCIEHYGAGEAYLPILEALGRLCRGPHDKQLLRLLEQHAPTWVVQMPTLVSAAKLKALQNLVQGTTKDRMLRELAEALETITRVRPLVFLLEDLHWSDTATIDLLNSLARRREAARLLILGTYRPMEVIVREHRLKEVKQELQLHQQCEELPLRFLSAEAVSEYLRLRFPDSALPERFATLVYERTDGNPLFMVNIVDEFVRQGVLRQQDGQWLTTDNLQQLEIETPNSLQNLIETQIERLSAEEQRVMEAGSVAGMEFSAAAIAAATEQTVEEIEAQCEGIARRGQFVQGAGMSEWPDGTVATRYRFTHALGQEGLYKRIPAARQTRLHQQIGERVEAGYGERANEIAAELAVHFERGREYRKAVHYLHQAALTARQRSAHQEVIHLLTKALSLLNTLPDVPERAQQELLLQTTLGPSFIIVKGNAAPEVERTFTRALTLCKQVGQTPQLFPVIMGLYVFFLNRPDFRTARALAEQSLRLAQNVQVPIMLGSAHDAIANVLVLMGEFIPAQAHFEQTIALYAAQRHHIRDRARINV